MNSHKVKIDGIDLGHAKISIDGVHMRCRAINVDMAVDQAHLTTVTMEDLAVPEIGIDSLVTFDFTPKTVEQALGVLRGKIKNANNDEKLQLIVGLKGLINELG